MRGNEQQKEFLCEKPQQKVLHEFIFVHTAKFSF